MRPDPKKRVPINPPREGLNNALAELHMPGLPPGAANPAPPEPVPGTPRRRPGRVIVRRETARRAGRTVILIEGFSTRLGQSGIEALATHLRRACGSGGSVKERAIEIQGEQLEKVRALLEAEGFEVAGGR